MPVPSSSFEDLFEEKLQFSNRGSVLLNGQRIAMFADVRDGEAQHGGAQEDDLRLNGGREGDAEENCLRAGESPAGDAQVDSSQAEDSHIGDMPHGGSHTLHVPHAQSSNATAASESLLLPSKPPSIANSLRPTNDSRVSILSKRILSADETELSQRVRSMYEFGNERGVDWTDRTVLDDVVVEEEGDADATRRKSSTRLDVARPKSRSRTPVGDERKSLMPWDEHEAAGGLEDWQDVSRDEVDRFGFIIPAKPGSKDSNMSSQRQTQSQPQLMRVSTALMKLSETPRGKRSMRRSASRISNADAGNFKKHGRNFSRSSRDSLHGGASIRSVRSISSMSFRDQWRMASNRLPHNRERKFMDEASYMLTPPPGFEDIAAEKKQNTKLETAQRVKEGQRAVKWRKMGRPANTSTKGGGMRYMFDPKDPKVVSRTWKGIPDTWRASAWYSFLYASAAKRKDLHCDEELIEIFQMAQSENSPDDVQIDCDVPRTINRHIMFRRRYRGGQRLLFRVLHALSLYFPETGYVQGMATIAATLLCYYDEDHAFIMMVRLWQLRGLDRLYSAGFGGLMEALDDFEKNWLRGGDVARKLEELGITSTAYGTRWYLTMFNYSIPFAAQLRVWDCFMLLGDLSEATDRSNRFAADLDVLHATSMAMIDAMKEILLESDFEGAMKVITSFVPVNDPDLLMKVAQIEYGRRKKRAREASFK